MIHVYYGSCDNHYNYLLVKGHAMSDDFGRDLICAGVSSIVFGLMNAIDMVDKQANISVEDNQIEIELSEINDKTDNYLELAILQLKTIEESYSQYIKIDERRKHK